MNASQLTGHTMSLSAASFTPLLLLLAVASASVATPEKNTPESRLFPCTLLSPLVHIKAGDAVRSVLSNFDCKLDDSECLKKYLQDDIFARFSKGKF
ncbi:hypothetical protein PR048_016896 [Dryococelus australis]|uniref:Uncharacterized protein n=1 Tax=Dryococelus australis TaxID=614101 RepID=A0ABQ9H7Z2_9NEOP|nr:hypothetical protein PR048_016896 [Dryococelus australis]